MSVTMLHRFERANRAMALHSLNIDHAALDDEERWLLTLAYEGHIFHPNDHKKLTAAIERTRRDR